MLRTIRLLITFDGTRYHGWQRQHNGITVQGVLEEKLGKLCKKNITLHGAGRTDAGVHALGMVAHFHLKAAIPLKAFTDGLNSMLPRDIRILDACEEEPEFHSRYNALGKTYRYDFFTGPLQQPTTRLYAAHFPGFFDPSRLIDALQIITGTHDFSSFERVGSRNRDLQTGRGAVRTIYKATCSLHAHIADHWSIQITGDGFLRQMVRILAGSLIEVGQGERSPASIQTALVEGDRTKAGMTAPAHGLFLEKIYYQQLFHS